MFSFISTVVSKVERCVYDSVYDSHLERTFRRRKSSSWKAKATHRGYFGSSRDHCESIRMQVSNEKRKERQDVKIFADFPSTIKGSLTLNVWMSGSSLEIGQATNDCPKRRLESSMVWQRKVVVIRPFDGKRARGWIWMIVKMKYIWRINEKVNGIKCLGFFILQIS